MTVKNNCKEVKQPPLSLNGIFIKDRSELQRPLAR